MAENTNLGLTAEAWADITIKRWEQKIVALSIGDSRTLINSFAQQVITDSGGNPDLIRFTFEYYGRMVDMGVGRGIKAADIGLKETTRRPKPWYSRTFAAQVHKLAEILAAKYGRKAVAVISETITKKNAI